MEWSGVEWNRPGRWRGPPRSGYTVLPSSFSEAPQASSPLRRGSVRQKPCLTRGGQGATSREQHPRGGGGGGEEESGEQGDGTEKGETDTDRLRPTRGRGRCTASGRTSRSNIHTNKQTNGTIRPRNRDTNERREADVPSHSAPAPQAQHTPTPQGRHKRAQRGRHATIMQSEPTGKTSERREADKPSHSAPAPRA